MRKLAVLLVPLALMVSACGAGTVAGGLDTIGSKPPETLVKTAIDEAALEAVWKTLGLVQDAVNLYLDAKPSAVGSPFMLRFADANDKVVEALTAATAAARAGNATTYKAALANAEDALLHLRAVLKAK